MDRRTRGELRKRVTFVAKQADEQIAVGVVMVPNAVDLQGDWVTEETIRGFAAQFGNFIDAGEASGGIMHAAWPADWMALEDNRVLDSAQTIGGVEVPAGAWVQEWRFTDDDLWGLVDDGVLGGYSIGAVDVEWRGPMDQADLPDGVTVPDEFDEEDAVWELVAGIIREVSAVDIPAVPDAMILETKADKDEAMKRLADHLGNRDGFMEEAMARGHAEAEAERLWEVLNRAVDVAGAGDPGSQSLLEAGRSFLRTLTGSDDAAPHRGRDRLDAEAPVGTEKEGRTLSQANRDDLKAVIDAGASVLMDAGVDAGFTRFTDREDDPFDLSQHAARAFDPPDDGEEGDGAGLGAAADTNTDPTGNTGGWTPDMSDNKTQDDPWEDAPEWAKSLRADVESHGNAIDDLKDGEDDADPGPWDDAPEWALDLKAGVEQNAQAIDTIGKQSGLSDQLGGEEEAAKDGETDEVTAFKQSLVGGRRTRAPPAAAEGGD